MAAILSNSGAAPVTKVQISKLRMEALLESEITHFAIALRPHPITLRQILAHDDAETFRKFLLEELPIRYARRIRLIEDMPGWSDAPHMRVCRSIYNDAFRRLRSVAQTDSARFRSTLLHIKRRTSNMVSHVVMGTRAIKKSSGLSDSVVDTFLDRFLTDRIATDTLSSQYLQLTHPSGRATLVNPQCDPEKIIRSAAADAIATCEKHYRCAPPVDVVGVGHVRFPFIESYLNYIMFELIKNSLRAVTERFGTAGVADHPIRIVVCGDESNVVIRVSDTGGGIRDIRKAESYLYTTAESQCDAPNAEVDLDDEYSVAPMAGFGCGLPISRNCAFYVGGRLELNSTLPYGTDAYLYFNRLGDAQEYVGTEIKQLPSRGLLPRRGPSQ